MSLRIAKQQQNKTTGLVTYVQKYYRITNYIAASVTERVHNNSRVATYGDAWGKGWGVAAGVIVPPGPA